MSIGVPPHPRRPANDVPERRVRARKLLDRDAVAELAEPLTAELFAKAESEEAHAGHRVDDRSRDLVLLFDLALERRELGLDELPDGALEHDELLRKDWFHQAGFARSS